MAVVRRLTTTEVAAVRAKLQVHQGNRCPLCGCSLKGRVRGGPALDHCHETGFIRDVLCMTCNGGEGKVKSLAIRYGLGKENHVQWLLNLAAYLQKHSTPQYSFIHPTHLTKEETRIKTNLKAKKKRATLKKKTAVK
jgi:hypothetical protein